jgi:hypothetical protein
MSLDSKILESYFTQDIDPNVPFQFLAVKNLA